MGLTLAALVTGVFSGLGAIALHYVLDFMQELTFGQAEGHHPMVTDGADPARRALILAALGPFVALVWYYLQSGGRRVVGVNSQIAGATEEDRTPSLWQQISHSVIQIVAVGAGSPVGKEVAPRELGALAAGRCACFLERMGSTRPDGAPLLGARERRLLVAAGAASGLAAVYQVPIGGVVYLVEAMAVGLSLWSLYVGAVTVWTATVTANLVIVNEPTYPVPQLPLDATTLTVAALTGVVLTPLALGFRALSQRAEKIKAKDRSLLWRIPVAFALVAVVSLWLPEILGNGRLLTQHTFNEALAGGLGAGAVGYVAALTVAKAAVVVLSLRSGSYGGTLTPGLALGAAAAFCMAALVLWAFPGLGGVPGGASMVLYAAALTGTAAFLGVSMNAPLSALALLIGFTGQGASAWLPMAVAVGTAVLTRWAWTRAFGAKK
ncbi:MULTISPECIES: chloride channel protein [unclassified Rothia (in: high G+C Gram-positive bacteria)]|uniref:chloride channel protein n=1 Tax=unclassified Rothia (in: high G+C Gram-positive bacteria) TaxID=2689056 RepID=UPI00244939AE|nr:chloride channel protein [Rothia sp. RSM42]